MNLFARIAFTLVFLTGQQVSVFAFQNGDLSDDFETAGELTGFVTNNPNSLPDVVKVDGRYRANVINNDNNITLHFNEFQGRLDAKLLAFPFEFIARNIGIGTQGDSQTAPASSGDPYIFSGVQVHVPELESRNSSHVVVGHRGPTEFTIEGKNTLNGVSSVNDAGEGIVPDGRADIRIVGNEDRTITVYWQLPEQAEDNWTLYNDTGTLPGTAPTYGDSVYVGLITYVFEQNGLPFVGTCDGIEVTQLTATSNEITEEPVKFSLEQNYPNPFNPTTKITFTLDKPGFTSLIIYDASGRKISTLAGKQFAAGLHTVDFNSNSLGSGTYFYTLTVEGKSLTRMMSIIK
ncbi:MAG: T9SS type A sorting domain-containing protein [Balneolaceae bacterium]|nr:T9SS type A sorting domain-containing protein [Balneolaceae bacterium]MBO6546477.1 T9SS type A sorting domain-containing protein [Balneolaceae bacterium]MBO6648836.1 T9SS type A sorting domain-containing protein [Balneolaceae bacterium]